MQCAVVELLLADYQSYKVWKTLDANLFSYGIHKVKLFKILAETGQLCRHW